MNLPRPMVKAVEAMMKAADTRSCLGMAEGCTFAHDSIYRALSQRLRVFFADCLTLCKRLGGLTYGYLARPSGSKKANCGGLASWSTWCVGEGTTPVPMPCA